MCTSKPKEPKMPKMPAPPPPPEEKADEALRRSKDDERKRARLASGRSSTILTSPFGAESKATVARKTLLGQ